MQWLRAQITVVRQQYKEAVAKSRHQRSIKATAAFTLTPDAGPVDGRGRAMRATLNKAWASNTLTLVLVVVSGGCHPSQEATSTLGSPVSSVRPEKYPWTFARPVQGDKSYDCMCKCCACARIELDIFEIDYLGVKQGSALAVQVGSSTEVMGINYRRHADHSLKWGINAKTYLPYTLH